MDGRWVIHALTPDGTTPGQIPEMWRSLLQDRFHFSAHYDTIQHEVWALVTIKGNSKLLHRDQLIVVGATDRRHFKTQFGRGRAHNKREKEDCFPAKHFEFLT